MIRFRKKPSGRQVRQSPGRPAYNYYHGNKPAANETPARIPRQPRNLLKLAMRRLTETVTILAILALLVYSSILNPTPKVEVSSQLYHATTTYQQAVTDQLKSLRNRTKITFDERGIVRHLESKYPEIGDVNIHLPLAGHSPTVSLVIAAPSFKLSSRGQNYLVDSQGTVVGSAANFPNFDKIPTVIDQSGFPIEIGKPAISSTTVYFINQLIMQLQHDKIGIKSLILPVEPQALQFQAADEAYYVKFYLGGDPLVQTGQYLASRAKFHKSHHQPAHYLDVRVAGKVFYK